MSKKEVYELALKHAVYNAYKHGGKAEFKVVVSKIAAENPDLRKRMREVIPIIRKAVEDANKMSLEEQEKFLRENYPELLEEKKEEKKEGLPPLPDVERFKVVKTRFAPNPDFVIHLGNARPAILSHEYARMYNGKMVLRFEDTDPRTKTPVLEAYRRIREDLAWLGVKWDEEYIQSLRMSIFYEVARKLIERGGAYVDDMSKEEFSKLLAEGKPHPNRDKPPEHNLELFDKMLRGYYGEGEAVLRVKTDIHARDKSIIDWVAFRVIDTDRYPHPLVGSRYIVWPTYNFAAAVDDHLLGITHIIRGKEHRQNTIKQQYLYDHMGWEYPVTLHIGRLKLEGFIMSKSEIRRILREKSGGYTGPDDPRFGTICGLRRRGILAESIRRVILEVGPKKTDASISYANLAAENRKILDPRAPRLLFVRNPRHYILEGLPSGGLKAVIPYHPDNAELGSREYVVTEGDEVSLDASDATTLKNGRIVRLMGLGNFLVKNSKLVLHSTSVEEARKVGAAIIQWVKTGESRPAIVLRPEGEELVCDTGLIEEKVPDTLGPGSHVQFVRYGFVRIENLTPTVRAVYAHQ